MGKALYRKYRSRSLDEIVGQDHVTGLLRRALERNRVAHAYLFTGPRGVGKTSIARILAHEINNLPYSDESNHLDIIEIDAASNNGVDDIRDLRDKVQLAPVSANKKVYIIDEVHMLSKPAFNALLKTLEEPPEHVVFILATTDVEKLPETIISRTQRHTFRRASADELVTNMKRIAASENIHIDEDALLLIAEHSDGGYRDSVSMLDQLANTVDEGEAITQAHVERSLGLAPHTRLDELLDVTQTGDIAAVAAFLQSFEATGIQAKTVALQLIRRIRDKAQTSPQLLPLMSELIEVGQSSLPHAKLLTILGLYSRVETSPLSSNGAEIKPHIAVPAQTPGLADTPSDVVEKPAKAAEPSVPNNETKPKKSKKVAQLDWQKFIEDVRTGSIALYSVLSKCGYELNGLSLQLYTKNEFYKKKLDNPKSLAALQSALRQQIDNDWELTLIPTTKPHSDSQTAAIAAMMGGGEEVELDD